MTQPRTLSFADRVFRSSVYLAIARQFGYEIFFAVLLLNAAMRSRISGPTPGFL
jgi:hypothetical protein